MSSLPPQTVVLTHDNASEVSSELEVVPVPTIVLQSSNSPLTKKHLLHRYRHSRNPPYLDCPSPLSDPLEALQTGSLSYASTTHYRPTPESSTSLKEFLPIPEAIARTQTFALLEPFLFPLLFPLGCCTAILQSIYMVLPIFPAAIIVGIAGSIIIPFICLGTISVGAVVVLKAVMRMVQKRVHALAKLGVGIIGAVERVAKLYRDAVVMLMCLARSGRRLSKGDSDDGRSTERKPSASRRASLKPGPSILKPSRPIQVYEELPPSPLPTPTVRPRATSFNGSSSSPVQAKAKEVFRTHLLAEKEKQLEAQLDMTNTQLPTPPSSDGSPSPPFGVLDIAPFTSAPSSTYEYAEGSPTAITSPLPTHYFTNPRYSVSSIDLSISTATSSYAPTPKTPGSPLVGTQYSGTPRVVKHVRIIEPSDELYYDAYEEDTMDGHSRPLFREFAAAKLQDALGLLQTSAGQVWGS